MPPIEGRSMTDATVRNPIDPKIINSVARLDLRARLVVEGYVSGVHRSPYKGFSVEFAEHREYAPGDDLRYLDWKVFGKTDRYYIKQYEEETNLLCHLVLDTSESMDFGTHEAGGRVVRKFDYAMTIAAALAYLIIGQHDAAGLTTFDEKVRRTLVPGSHAGHLRRIFEILEKTQPGGKTSIGPVLTQVADTLRKRGLVVVISDLVGDVDEVLRGLRRLRSHRHDVVVFHVLDPSEIEFPFSQMTLFEGLEEFPDLLADPKSLRQTYLAHLADFRQRLRAGCLGERIDVVEMNTRTPLDVALTSYLAHRAASGRHRG
jgi:uncharacterized protein (DUF58 family)